MQEMHGGRQHRHVWLAGFTPGQREQRSIKAVHLERAQQQQLRARLAVKRTSRLQRETT